MNSPKDLELTEVSDIIKEINSENGTIYKMSVLEKYKNNKQLKLVLKMAYDKVTYTYGVTMKNVHISSPKNTNNLGWGLDNLQKLSNREFTGHAAISLLECILEAMSEDNRDIIIGIINRDLRITLGRSSINKVFKNLIVKPIYCRCDIFTTDKILEELDKKGNPKVKKGTFRNIRYPAIIEQKADGTYREASIFNNSCSFISRSGEGYSYPQLEKDFSKSPDGFIHGEMTLFLDDKLLERILPELEEMDIKNDTNNVEVILSKYNEIKQYNATLKESEQPKEYILPRGISNGILNSDDIPYDNIIFDVWDYVTPEDYNLAALKDKKNLPKIGYIDRFRQLEKIVEKINNPRVRVIKYKIVENLNEATDFTSTLMRAGYEGAILKDFKGLFKDGTAKWQLKMKIAFEIDVRVTGFTKGKNKNKDYFGAITYQTDDENIIGKVGVNSMVEKIRNYIHERREEIIGSVMTIEGNDLTRSRTNNYYSVSHPRYCEIRKDKDTTDDLERAFLMLESAKEFK